MKKKTWISMILLIMFTNVYADDPASVQQGAEDYDWQSCLDAKANNCINACATSEDIHCKDNCNDSASDKCQSLGLKPPQ